MDPEQSVALFESIVPAASRFDVALRRILPVLEDSAQAVG